MGGQRRLVPRYTITFGSLFVDLLWGICLLRMAAEFARLWPRQASFKRSRKIRRTASAETVPLLLLRSLPLRKVLQWISPGIFLSLTQKMLVSDKSSQRRARSKPSMHN